MPGNTLDESNPQAARERFDALLRPVLTLAYRYACRLTGSPDDAMDLVQNAAVAAFQSFDTFKPDSNFRAWYLRILTNRFYRDRKNAARTATVALDEAPDLFLYDQAKRQGVPMEGDPMAAFFAAFDQGVIEQALDRLPEDYRVTANLHFLSEMPYEELAMTLDVPIGTVRSRLHRARKLLQVSLWRVAEERGLVQGEIA